MLTNASRTDADQRGRNTPAQDRAESASYAPPALIALGSLEVVQAGGGHDYYDGPHTRWARC